MKCAIYICQCGYRMEVPFRELKKHYQFNEEDLSSFPKIECDGCHRNLSSVKKIEELPDGWFPEWFPDPDFPEFMD